MDLFTLVARLGMDSSDYERGISKARGSFSEFGNFMSAKAVAMGNMISSAINKAVDIASDLGRSAIQNAADVAAERAQFKATFDTMQGEAERAFKEIEKSTGVFGTRLQNVGTKAFSQFKGAGLDGVQALDMMQEYTNLAADAAAYYDISLEDADARLRSFLRGNTEAGDAIGLFTSESQRNSAAMEKYGQKWTALNEAQKQMLMLDISKDIYEQSGAIGQAARESDSWTNVIGDLKEAWRQATGAFGEPIIAAITPTIQDVADFLNDPETKEKLTRFGLTVGNAIDATVDFVLGIPSKDEIAYQLNRWWEDVKARLNPFSVTATVSVKKVEESLKSDGIGGAIKTAVDEAWWNPNNWGTITKKTESGVVYESTHGGYGAGFATGLDYVPYNDFYARLHEGEAVLTKTEAAQWRKDDDYTRTDAELLSEIRALRQDLMTRRPVMTPDGRVLGEISYESVSQRIAEGARSRRYATV